MRSLCVALLGFVALGGKAFADSLPPVTLTVTGNPELTGSIGLGTGLGSFVYDFGSGNTATFTADDFYGTGEGYIEFENSNSDVGLIYVDVPSETFDGTTFSAPLCTSDHICDSPSGGLLLNGVVDPFILSGGGTITETLDGVAATPEPSSLALLGTGMLGGAAMLRRRWMTA